MENYLICIGKSALAAGAFYLIFLVLFQNRKQFVFNRFYLPVSLALSFLIPLITFTTTEYIEPPVSVLNEYTFLPETIHPVAIAQPQFSTEWYHYLFGIYILGATVYLFHLLLGYYKAICIVRNSRTEELLNTTVNITSVDVHPFSFFNRIVISEKTCSLPNMEMILNHEKIHVIEKHTVDILFTEILFLLQWFNPFAWLIKDAVKNNLEYKTDNEIVKTSNPITYQLAMIALANKKGVAPFLTALNGSQLKNRIIMMKKKTEDRYSLLKQLVVLPLLAVLIMGLSDREVKTEIKYLNEKTATPIEIQKETKSNLYPDTGQINIKGRVISLHERKPIAGVNILYTVNGIKLGTISNITGDFIIQTEDSKVFLEFLSEGYLKKEFAWDGSKELLVEMEIDKNAAIPDKIADKIKWEKMLREAGIERFPKGKEPIVIQDGYETLHNANDISNIYNPAIIKSIRYKKNTNIVLRRKELAKNGFIEIKTTLPKHDKKLYIIDGKEVFLKNQLPSVYIYPAQFQMIMQLSKDEAVKKYGKKAKHGAVEITTKTNALNEKNKELNKFLISAEFQQNLLILQGLEGDRKSVV